jgi:hypothetical protein
MGFGTMADDRDTCSEHLMTERDLAARWCMSQRSLQRWRSTGTGPTFVRIGRRIRYRLGDVVAFEEAPDGPVQGAQ